jgi:hypothetical protein
VCLHLPARPQRSERAKEIDEATKQLILIISSIVQQKYAPVYVQSRIQFKVRRGIRRKPTREEKSYIETYKLEAAPT